VKLNQTMRGANIDASNAAKLAEMLSDVPADFPYYGLLACLAELADDIAKGADAYSTFGSTKARDAFVFTVKYGGVGTPVYGADLREVSAKLEALL
jgi:hypothetical protein